MTDNNLTTVQIDKKYLILLGEIAEYFNRKKSEQLAWWIKNEHSRIFKDNEPVDLDEVVTIQEA
jgi:hypothetical protein